MSLEMHCCRIVAYYLNKISTCIEGSLYVFVFNSVMIQMVTQSAKFDRNILAQGCTALNLFYCTFCVCFLYMIGWGGGGVVGVVWTIQFFLRFFQLDKTLYFNMDHNSKPLHCYGRL